MISTSEWENKVPQHRAVYKFSAFIITQLFFTVFV